jgi:hypothetical protein
MLDAAYDLLTSAREFADEGGDGAIAKSRAYSLGVLVLVCCALEAAINVLAGCHFDAGPGSAEADEAGWPRRWHGPRGHSLAVKWIECAPAIAGHGFTALVSESAKQELRDVINKRHEFIGHFKGRWAPAEVGRDFLAMSVSDAERWLTRARDLIGAFWNAYTQNHSALVVQEQTSSPYPPPRRLHPTIPPVETGSAGISRMDILLWPGMMPTSDEDGTEG